MPIYDISLPVSESLIVWPGDPPIRITEPSHLDRRRRGTWPSRCSPAATSTLAAASIAHPAHPGARAL